VCFGVCVCREVYSTNRQVPLELPEAPAVIAGHLAYLASTGYPSMVGVKHVCVLQCDCM
jgi:hypothetical protein